MLSSRSIPSVDSATSITQTVNPHNDRVAVQLFSCPVPALRPSCNDDVACKSSCICISKVCFIHFIASYFILGLFLPLQRHQQLESASNYHTHVSPRTRQHSVPRPSDDYDDTPTVDGDDDACLCSACTLNATPIPTSTNRTCPISTSVPIAVEHNTLAHPRH